MLNFESLGITN